MGSELIIMGAGQAAAQAVHTLRNQGYSDGIALVGEEPHLPYQRPPLSKKFLSGEMAEDRLLLRPAEFYEANQVDLLLNESVTAISCEKKEVSLSKSGNRTYEQALITTGSRAKTIPLPGSHLKGVHSIRSISDVAEMRSMMHSGSRLVIVGAGYIGLEVAAIARQMNLEVVVIETQNRVLERVASPIMSGFFKKIHEENGVEIRISTQTLEIKGDTSVKEVMVSDGSHIKCDLVLMAVGSQPNVEIASESGIETKDGILVDQSCRTSSPDVFAAGDCTRFDSGRYGRSIRLESVQNAIDQAEAAAQAICGENVNYDPVPWFWSDQYDLKLQMAGLSFGYDEAITEGDPENRVFYIAYLKDGNLIAVDSMCHPKSYMLGRRSIGQSWKEDLLPKIQH